MKIKDFISVRFPQEESKTYYAIVTKILSDNNIECKFVHSGTIYIFKLESGWLEVKQTTGSFKKGTRTNNIHVFTETDQDLISVNTLVRVTFSDGNTYLGIVKSMTPLKEISFLHSGNTYSFDGNNIAHNSEGPYNGQKALEIKPYTDGKNPFSGGSDTLVSLSIADDFGKQLSGEFDVKIKRTDTDLTVYENNFLSAEDSTANDRITLKLTEGQNLIILLDFHPALQPYKSNPISSPDIDRDTTISGSKTFAYKKISNFHFDVILQNEVVSVTSTTSDEAILSTYREVSISNSHSLETKFEGETSIKLFGIGGTIMGGGGTTDTSDSANSTGASEGLGTSNSVSATWSVYYPRGLKISPIFQ